MTSRVPASNSRRYGSRDPMERRPSYWRREVPRKSYPLQGRFSGSEICGHSAVSSVGQSTKNPSVKTPDGNGMV